MPKSENNNPYVGPRAFSPDDESGGRGFYGRDREVEELTDLLLSDRVVLLYAPSGAGKTSLINARLVPRLAHQERFDVLPTISLKHGPSGAAPNAQNRYVYSALLSVHDGLPTPRRPQAPPAEAKFGDYLSQIAPLPCDESAPDSYKPQFLIFDQFEEVLRLDPIDHAAKREFFTQVGDALRDRRRWALFSMREDYVAALDPFLPRIPTRLRSTFRLDYLGKAEAIESIQQPARDAGVIFHGIAVKQLVEELSKVQVQRLDGDFDPPRSGPYVEPVQLQVVCWQLWEKLPLGATEIGRGDLDKISGDVDEALANYYRDKVKQAAMTVEGVRERVVRQWFENLITEKGIRVPVLREVGATRNLDNRAIEILVAAHLVRPDDRDNRTWYELAHDRLINPIRKDNARWLEGNLSQSWSLSSAEQQQYTPVAKGNRHGAALCLGGMGLRAALFHLGALTRLNELGVLSQLDTISSTGGGSLLAAHLMKRLDPWPASGTVIDAKTWTNEVALPFRIFALKGLTRMTPPLVAISFMFFFNFGRTRGIDKLRRHVERHLIRLPLSKMPDRPKYIFGATDTTFASPWMFEKSRMGDYEVGYVSPPPEHWTVADAVAAAAALQPLFGSMQCELRAEQFSGGNYEGPDRDELLRSLRLSNGAHTDHLALEPVWRRHEVVLVSDCGSRPKPSTTGLDSLTGVTRASSIYYAQNDALRKGWLLSNFVSNILQGTYWSSTRHVSEYDPSMRVGYSQSFVENYLSSLPWDLEPISYEEVGVLENHGYLMAEVGMRRNTARYFETRRAELNVPFPEMMDEERAVRIIKRF